MFVGRVDMHTWNVWKAVRFWVPDFFKKIGDSKTWFFLDKSYNQPYIFCLQGICFSRIGKRWLYMTHRCCVASLWCSNIVVRLLFPRSSTIAEMASSIKFICATLFVPDVCLLDLAVHIKLVKNVVFLSPCFFLKKCGTQKMRFSRDSNMFRYRCFGWMTLSRDRGFGDDGRCSDQNSTSQVFKNCGCAFLSETIVCHIVCTNCVSVLLICT